MVEVHKLSECCPDNWIFVTNLKSAFTCNPGEGLSHSVKSSRVSQLPGRSATS